MTQRTYFLTVYHGGAGYWYWRIQAKNGRIVADGSEGYKTEAGARAAARRLIDAKVVIK